jgi:hypothetical protein
MAAAGAGPQLPRVTGQPLLHRQDLLRELPLDHSFMMLGGSEPSSQQKGTGMGSGLEFFVRAFTYACAFIGAAWFGYFAYTVGFGAADGLYPDRGFEEWRPAQRLPTRQLDHTGAEFCLSIVYG